MKTEIRKVRPFDFIRDILMWLLVLFAVFIAVFSFVSSTRFNDKTKPLFGLTMFVVRSDSMKATDFAAGDVILVRQVDTDSLAAGDIIAFESVDTVSFGETITHKIKEVHESKSGIRSFVTYGTTTGATDETPVHQSHVIGKYVGKIPYLGWFSDFLKKPIGYVTCVLFPCMALIVSQLVSIVVSASRKRKAEIDALGKERDSVSRELEEARKLRSELEQLRQQLTESGSQEPPDLSKPSPPDKKL